MRFKNINITEILREALPVNSFLFNPSIAHVSGDTYLVSVRSYIHNIKKPFDEDPRLMENPQHPWGTDWSGTDVTYILPLVITENNVQPITTGVWPLVIPVQDMRIFRFDKESQHVGFILTFNERYDEFSDVIIKAGDVCDEKCYLIGWGYLLVDINTLQYNYLPGKNPLCPNISNPVDKNWSLWRYEHEEKVYLMLSYVLAPVHTAFSFSLEKVSDGEVVGGSTCRMETPRPGKNENLFGELEKYYKGNLFVSLSTPSYPVGTDTYQSVGHIKVRLDYIKKLADSNKSSPLAKFARKYVKARGKKHFNPNWIYLMFLYTFQIVKTEKGKDLYINDTSSGYIELTGSKTRIHAVVTHVTPAFVCKVDDYDYFLNFPAGTVVNKKNTIISYGDGDATSQLMWIPNKELKELLTPVTGLTAKEYEFLHGELDDGEVEINF